MLHPEQVAISVQSGSLSLVPTTSLWFNATEGPFVYKSVNGNFKATARVHVRSVASPSQPPAIQYRLAGIMARDPASNSGPENYVFVVLGADDNDLSTEHKSTSASVSTYQGPTWSQGPDAELRLCRVGTVFSLLVRPVTGGAWQTLSSYPRGDLPASLQVGPVAYANQPTPDLRASFDEVTFADAQAAPDCSN